VPEEARRMLANMLFRLALVPPLSLTAQGIYHATPWKDVTWINYGIVHPLTITTWVILAWIVIPKIIQHIKSRRNESGPNCSV